MWKSIKRIFKNYFITGLIILGPLVISFWFLAFVVRSADRLIDTSGWLPFSIPGQGILVAVGLILTVGFLGRNFLGRFFFGSVGDVLAYVPVLGTVYKSMKQIFDSLLGERSKQFGKVVLVNFPTDSSWVLAFMTKAGTPPEVAQHFDEPMISVFMPTTPNPTSGYFMYVPKSKSRETDISVDTAFKYIVSMGLLEQDGTPRPVK